MAHGRNRLATIGLPRGREAQRSRAGTALENIPKIPKINSSFTLDNADKYSIL